MELDEVYEGIRNDRNWDHLRGVGIRMVPGRGNSECPLAMIVGEAPGATENAKRMPFVGISGRVLKQLMALASLSAEDEAPDGDGQEPSMATGIIANAFITNVVKYRPPGNRTPTAREIYDALPALREEWKAIGRPPLIVTVGAVARAALTPVELRLKPGGWAELPDGRTSVYVQYHPQWGIRNGQAGKETMERQWEEMGTWMRARKLL